MVNIKDTYADTLNVQPSGRSNINRPSPSPSSSQDSSAQNATEPVYGGRVAQLRGTEAQIREQLAAEAERLRELAQKYAALTQLARENPRKYNRTKRRSYSKRSQDYKRRAEKIETYSSNLSQKSLTTTSARASVYQAISGVDDYDKAKRVAAYTYEERSGRAAKIRAQERPQETEPTPPVYDVQDAQGKTWRSANTEWLLQKTGVDVTKVRADTEVVRDSVTGQVYYGKEETVGGKQVILAVGKKRETKGTTEKVGVSTLPAGKTSQEFFQEGRIQGAITDRQPKAFGVGNYGDNISTQPAGTETKYNIWGDTEPYEGMTVSAGDERNTDRFSSRKRWDLAQQAYEKGNIPEFSNQASLALATGSFETIKALTTDPINTLIDPIAHPVETFKAVVAEGKTNPVGLIGQLGTGLLITHGVTKGYAKLAGKQAGTLATENLAKSQTAGTEFIYNDAGGYVTKTTETTVKVGGRQFDVVAGSQERFGVGNVEGLLPEGARPALRAVQQATGATKEPYTAGTGTFEFIVGEGGKEVITGKGTSGLAGQEVGGFDIFARTADAVVTTKKGTTTTSAFEIGALKEGVYAEIKGNGITEASGLIEGRSTTASGTVPKQDFYTTSPEAFLKAKGVKIKEVPASELLQEGHLGIFEWGKGLFKNKKEVTIPQEETIVYLNKDKVTTTKTPKADILRHEAIHADININNKYPAVWQEESFVLSQEANPNYRFLLKEPNTKPTTPTVTSKNIVIEGASVKYQDSAPSFVDPRSTSGSTFDIIGGEARTTTRTQFLTRENIEAFTGSTDFELPPAFEAVKKPSTPSSPLKGSGLLQETTTTAKPSSVTKLATTEKTIIADTIGKVVESTTKKPAVIGVVTTKKNVLTTSATTQAVRPLSSLGEATKEETKASTKQETKPAYSFVQVDKLASAQEVDTATRSITKVDQLAVQDLGQAQRVSQISAVAQLPVMTTAQRASSAFSPPVLPPLPPFTPPPIAPSLRNSPTNRQGGVFSVQVKKKGMFQTVGRTTDLKQAALIGQLSVEKSAAASFKVTSPKGATANVARFLPASFRKSKVSAGVFVQRREKRISSAGEKKDITAKGLFALRKKKNTRGWL